jgi:hypothetical protein
MGLFSTQHIFTAYAASSALIEEEDRNSTVQGLMVQGFLDDTAGPADAVKMGLQTDLYARSRSMLRYAKREDGYVYGTPEPTHPYKDYLPIVALMQDRIWFDEANDEALENTTKRILKRLALDPYEIKEEYILSVEEGIADGDRPGTNELDDWDFFIQFACPMKTRTRGGREYLLHYFKWLERNSWTDRADYEAFLAGGQSGDQPTSNFHISEGEGSDPDWTKAADGYEVYYKWSYVTEIQRAGEYTPPGWTEPLRPNHCYSKIYQPTDADYAEGIEEVHGEGAAVASSAGNPEGTYHTYAVFTQQGIDGTYTQILIMAPSMMYVINVTDENGTVDWQYVDVPLFPEDPEEESEFRWPILVEALKEVSAMHREEMLQEALCATVFLVEHQKVKWYQKTFFKWLIVIIVIIIVIIAQQYHLLAYIKEMAAAAIAVGATGTALAFSALYVAMTFALGFLISFAGSLIGGEWGQLFVLIATLYMAGINPFANLGQTWGSMVSNFGFGTAQAFLKAVMPFVQVVNLAYTGYQTDKLKEEMEDFIKTKQEKYEELENAYDMLGEVPQGIDPMFVTNAFIGHFNEPPDEYYQRVLNANPGVLGYDLVNDFAKIALDLPEAQNEVNVVDTVMNDFARQRGAA